MRVRTHTNPFNYYQRIEPLPVDTLFKNPTLPLDVEIGFGRGVFLRDWANKNPDRNIIGIEVRKQMVDILQNRLTDQQKETVHLVHNTGQIVIEDGLTDHSIDTIFIFHPDPWLKKRHHKRRVIQEDFLRVLHQKLKPTGTIHFSTDVKDLYEETADLIQDSPHWKTQENHPFWKNYTSHWDTYSQEDNRTSHKLSFTPN